MNFKKLRKLRRDAKAISPIIATLLLIAIAVVAALVTYAWVMGYIGFQTSNSGNAVQIQSVSFVSGKVTTVYLENVGTGTVTVVPTQCLYVNGVMDTGTTASVTSLTSGSTATLIPLPTNQQAWPSGTMLTIKVTVSQGTYSQITQEVP